MEMESSRRPTFDRSRELNSVKKPRLSGENSRRPAPANTGNSSAGSGLGRFRNTNNNNNGNENNNGTGAGEVRGAIQQVQQYQELVNQYKTALAELTFNSKPMITNLTIIAGENLQAARAIAATICTNIIEVPSDQKLPSLYLLDSIVKNIGRDYIKFFAARLPEVFCKAYKQVEPPIHTGMRHLFGTWKGVFPHQQLQIIEMELGFSTAANGSSSGSAAPKADSRTPIQSRIHVNPNYLAARERLQLANRPKVTDISGADNEASEDMGRPSRTGNAGAERSWADPSVKIHGDTGYGDYASLSVKRPLSTSVGKPIGQGYEKRWVGAGGEVEDSTSTQRNGYGAQRGISNYKGVRSASTDIPLLQNPPRSSLAVSKSWKNSEEEEYRWDELGNTARDPSAVDKLEFNTNSKRPSQGEVRSSFETFSKPKETPFAQARSSSPMLLQGTRPATGLSSIGATATATATSSTKASVGHQRPPGSAMSKRDPRQSLNEKEFMKSQSLARMDPRAASISGQPNTGVHDLRNRNLNSQLGTLQKAQSQTLQKSSSALSSIQQRPYVPSSEHLSNPETELSGIVKKAQKVLSSSSLKRGASPDSSNPLLGNADEQSNVSNLLAAVMRSGLISGGSISGQVGAQTPATTLASKDGMMSTSLPDAVSLLGSQKKEDKSPLPPGSSNSLPLVTTTSAHTSKQACGDSDPRSILNTLISKGLISAPIKEETPPATLPEQSPLVATSAPVTRPPVLRSCTSPLPASIIDKTSSSRPPVKVPDGLVQSAKAEVQNLIGYEFKPPLLREFHAAVIDGLSDDLPHKCTVCGLCYKLSESLAKHSEWHAFKNSVENCLDKPSRRWFSNTTDWIAGNVGFPFGYNSICPSVGSSSTAEDNEKMVLADESQCVCLLCGELFEDFYSQERDEWMFKGAVYIPNMSGSAETEPSYERSMHNMIVHSNCMSADSVRELGLIRSIKTEKFT